jgi:hypothetical protein
LGIKDAKGNVYTCRSGKPKCDREHPALVDVTKVDYEWMLSRPGMPPLIEEEFKKKV